MTRTFPAHGELWPVLEQRLLKERVKDTPWLKGLSGAYWPDAGGNVRLVAKAAADHMFDSFLLGAKYGEPSSRMVENEVTAMTLEILAAPEGAATTITAGGTESNFQAVKTARDWAREHRPKARDPELLLSFTAHPSFDKAAHICGIRTRRVPERADFRADIPAMEKAIGPNTIMIVGSAPAYSHGVVDDIDAIGALARKHGLWGHVDSCVGGFLIPFLRKNGRNVRNFDFTIEGVDSISADLHKFGLVHPHGISTFSLRDAANLKYQQFDFDNWPYGRYAVKTFAGSRSGLAVGAAWAVMRHLGEDGYRKRAELVTRMAEILENGIKAIPGLRMLAPPEAGCFVYTSDEVDIVAVAEALTARGHDASWCKKPPAIHILLYPIEEIAPVADYLAALAEAVAEVRATGRTAKDRQATYA
jgi:glutamate/tyrosine decarboxylase-like PLP-dependent enzyme